MASSNHLLDALGPAEMSLLAPGLQRLELRRDQLLAEPGQPVPFAYFPVSCVISVVAVMRDGRQVETRTIGREGGFGLLHAIGSRISFERVTAQIGGESWRAPLHVLAEAAAASPAFSSQLVRHAQATLLQAAQSTACNTLHNAQQRLSRWLLLTSERLGADLLPLTQEHLAIMLGVQRTTVTAVASDLQSAGMIAYARGRIRILDRAGLLARACECYETIELAARRLLAEPVG